MSIKTEKKDQFKDKENFQSGVSAAVSAGGSAAGLAEGSGISISRRFTRAGVNPLDEIQYDKRTSVITNPDGSVVFKM